MTRVIKQATRRPRAERETQPRDARPSTLPVRAQKKLDTRDRIRAAAWELFTTVGYDATTTKAVAQRAGVASGTVFVHAADKPDLLFLVMHDRLAATVDAQMATLPHGRSLVDQLMHIFGGLLRMYGEHPDVSAAFIRVLPGGSRGRPNGQQVDALTFAFLHRLSLLVHEAQARGEVARDVEPILVAQHVFAVYFFSLITWLGGFGTVEAVEPVLRMHLQLLVRGVGAR
jgi:AcrR family transcriptional regulator